MSAAARHYTFAHRGGRAHGPDNTIATFKEALARGATGLETDAWITADGAVVLDHDGVHRVAKRQHEPITNVRRDELPAHIPTLEEVYAACGTDFDLAIDVKRQRAAAVIIDVARKHGALDRLWLVAPATHLLSQWRLLDPAPHLAHTIKLRERSTQEIEAVAAGGGDALNMRWPWWTKSFVERIHDLGMLAFAYDAQSRFALRRCMRLGLDGVFSDHVDRMTSIVLAHDAAG